ncbi:YgaP family membrane protein [Maribacter sp. 2-571]|uniref:YgaP family membrane protein n=1 Tax=Maribacter sp. 2-571 TaxID=3417569 RepID=UPI003D3295CE
MNRFIKGLTYGFSRNLGKKDRIIRAIISMAIIASWYFGVISGVLGIVSGILAIMVLGTAATARCGINYMANISTVPKHEQEHLSKKGIKFEK